MRVLMNLKSNGFGPARFTRITDGRAIFSDGASFGERDVAVVLQNLRRQNLCHFPDVPKEIEQFERAHIALRDTTS